MPGRFISFFLLISISLCARQSAAPAQSFAQRIAHLHKIDGLFPLYWDEHSGKMWLEIDRFDEEFLYITALSAGIGSNDLGLDRGLMNEPQVVSFERSGPKVLLIQSNYDFRTTSGDAAERRAEQDSFARSALGGFEVAAEDGSRVLVDATDFFLRDAAGVAEQLRVQKQGNYSEDLKRSAFYLPLTKGFPKNTEIETIVTFTGEASGKLIREVTPTPDAVTVREHQSFVALPPPGYQPRLQDPRAGFFSVDFMDFSAPVNEPVMKRYITRHRLEKKDPSAAISDPVQPIIYYVDPGVPEPVRTALLEGASWWNQAFEAAGFRNAFQVRVLPADADPMDVRYNVIQWIDRSTRGWSYGNSLVDPRTGEIIKGIVSLGSLRAHQDYLILEGLMAPYAPGHDETKLLTDTVYARLHQLAAHEVGHTLGLGHNFIASTHGRASVMDYPGPWIELRPDDTFDLSNAYASGIGEWDKVAIRWGYSQFPPGTDERTALNNIIEDAAKRGLTFITDADSREPGTAHAKSSLWDNGPNAVNELNRIMKIRALALSRFGENNIREGAPMATLDEVLAPLYFLHRYQAVAAAKVLGGDEYTYALRGDGQPITQIVPAAEQRRALEALVETINPAKLTIPERILNLIPPRPPAYPRTRETFPSKTGVTFDPLSAAEAAANMTVSLILNPPRAARLVQYHAENNANPGLQEVIDALFKATWQKDDGIGLEGQVARTAKHVVLVRLMALAADESASTEVRSIAISELATIKAELRTHPDAYAARLIDRFEREPGELELPPVKEPPPGQPIGDDQAINGVFGSLKTAASSRSF